MAPWHTLCSTRARSSQSFQLGEKITSSYVQNMMLSCGFQCPVPVAQTNLIKVNSLNNCQTPESVLVRSCALGSMINFLSFHFLSGRISVAPFQSHPLQSPLYHHAAPHPTGIHHCTLSTSRLDKQAGEMLSWFGKRSHPSVCGTTVCMHTALSMEQSQIQQLFQRHQHSFKF